MPLQRRKVRRPIADPTSSPTARTEEVKVHVEQRIFSTRGHARVTSSIRRCETCPTPAMGLLPRRAPHEEFCEDYCPEEW